MGARIYCKFFLENYPPAAGGLRIDDTAPTEFSGSPPLDLECGAGGHSADPDPLVDQPDVGCTRLAASSTVGYTTRFYQYHSASIQNQGFKPEIPSSRQCRFGPG